MTIKDFEEFLTANAASEEVKAILRKAIKPEMKAEQFKAFIETPEGKALITPEIDRRNTEAIKTYRENHFEKELKERLEEELKKANPAETPEMKRIRELEEKDKRRELEFAKEKLDRQVLEIASKHGVKASIISKLKFTSATEAEEFIKDFIAEKNEIEKGVANKLLNKSAVNPNGGDGSGDSRDLSKMSVQELMKLEAEGKLDALIEAK